MTLYALSLWLACIGLECLLLVRSWTSGWFKRYPFFFAYIACVFAQDLFFLFIYFFKSRYYTQIYWYGQFFSLVVGCAVSWEIFRLVLGRYPGAGRMARNVLLISLIVVFANSLGTVWSGELRWPSTEVELERNLRAVQALALIVLALLSVYYKVPMGDNVKGIFTGYGLFIAMSVVTLTLRASVGKPFQSAWVLLQPFCYAAVLVIWCASLWKCESAAPLESQPRLEKDYRTLAHATKRGLIQARDFLGKAMRP